jgi:DNA-binding transcriptional LysR family regulator
MNDRIYALRLFARVARTGSFSAAGREFNVSQPSASRIVASLEKSVGAALLTRTTRAVTLTEAGVDYLARIEPILAALEEADHAARGTGELRGLLRVSTSTTLAVREVIPSLGKFLEKHPALRIDFVLDDRRQDLVSEAVDVALRIGTLTETSAVARRIGVSHRLLAASPAYLKKQGTPKLPGDLAEHRLIVGPPGLGPDAWTFRKDGKTTSIRVDGRVMVNVNEGAIAAAVAGLGIVSTGHVGCRAEIDSGALVRVLAEWQMGSADINAILPAGRAAKPSARAFTEFLLTEFRGIEHRSVAQRKRERAG